MNIWDKIKSIIVNPISKQILGYVNKINNAIEEDLKNKEARFYNLNNILFELIGDKSIQKNVSNELPKSGTFMWRILSISKILDSAWQKNINNLRKSSTLIDRKLINDEGTSYIDASDALQALNILKMKGNKNSRWTKTLADKIIIPEKLKAMSLMLKMK